MDRSGVQINLEYIGCAATNWKINHLIYLSWLGGSANTNSGCRSHGELTPEFETTLRPLDAPPNRRGPRAFGGSSRPFSQYSVRYPTVGRRPKNGMDKLAGLEVLISTACYVSDLTPQGKVEASSAGQHKS